MAKLRTGWEPDTTDDDTVLRQAVYNFADFNVGIAEVHGARTDWTDDLALADLGRASGFLSNATLLRPLDGSADEVAQRIEAFFVDGEKRTVDIWSAWPTADLTPRGFQLGGHPPLMVRVASEDSPAPPAELDIREVRDGDDVKRFEDVVKAGFGASEGPSVLDERWLQHPNVRAWIGYVDGQPASTGAVCLSRGVNGVQMIATLPDNRGHGYGEAMTWKATTAEPSLPAVLLASDLGRPVYERMGYVAVMRFTYWRFPRP